MRLLPLGDSAVVLVLGEVMDEAMLAQVQAVAAAIRQRALDGVADVVPAFACVVVYYDLRCAGQFEALCAELESLANAAQGGAAVPRRPVEIPVAYGGEFGPDLDAVAAHAGRAADEVVALHCGATYRVHAIGFVPGFAYLGGLPAELHTPRRPTPRPAVAPGAVGIGGSQTGVYPLGTPGGWNLIGRTPETMFDARRAEPASLRFGDEVRFRAIDAAEFARLALAAPAPRAAALARNPTPGEADAAPSVVVEVSKAGMFTTVQDVGRRGQRASGVPSSGGADSFAVRLANLLVGNPAHAATLELTLVGPELRFSRAVLVALAGAEFEGLPAMRPVLVEPGQIVNVGVAREGCRGYLAIAGGFAVPPVLDSRSTYLRGALGGHEGRALRDGDVLTASAPTRRTVGRWQIDRRVLPPYSPRPVLRVLRGAHAGEFPAEFFSSGRVFAVSPQSDRMGVRLAGAALARTGGAELTSWPVVPGTVQVPPDGQPIILLADAQTLGGYPQVAHVISVDLPLVAQLRPGDAVRFAEVSLDEAHRLALARERALALLSEGLARKFS